MLTKAMHKYCICLITLLAGGLCFASLDEKIEKIISANSQAEVKFGIVIKDANTGESVYCHNADLPLSPASNMKVLTSFAALKYLGREFEFVTTAGVIDNKLAVIGSGDPLLGTDGSDFITRLVNGLKSRDVNEINGIVIDSTVFDDLRVHPNWPRDQLNRSYAAEISGVNYNGNCVKILCSNKDGRIKLQTQPATAYLRLTDKVQPVSSGDSAIGSYRTQTENSIIVFGKCRKAASFDVAIERPSAFFGFLLAEALNRAGIKTSGELLVSHVEAAKMELIARHKTPITDVLNRCNKDSFQLAAESLFKSLGAQMTTGGSGGSWPGGRAAIRDYLLWLGAEESHFVIDDGCGLSRNNKLTAGILTAVLSDAYSSDLWPIFRDSLPTGGSDGTLRRYFTHSKYKGKVFAKTGYINGVRALSGFCVGSEGEYIFSILANDANYKSKKAIYDIVKAIIDHG